MSYLLGGSARRPEHEQLEEAERGAHVLAERLGYAVAVRR